MTDFYFIRHGSIEFKELGTKFYQGWGIDMAPLSEEGIAQIEAVSSFELLKECELILTSPYGRCLHTAAILSKNLQIPISVETNLHEMLLDRDYVCLDDEEGMRRFEERIAMNGEWPEGEEKPWESKEEMQERIISVLAKYMDRKSVIVISHGSLMQYLFNTEHPGNGSVMKLTLHTEED